MRGANPFEVLRKPNADEHQGQRQRVIELKDLVQESHGQDRGEDRMAGCGRPLSTVMILVALGSERPLEVISGPLGARPGWSALEVEADEIGLKPDIARGGPLTPQERRDGGMTR